MRTLSWMMVSVVAMGLSAGCQKGGGLGAHAGKTLVTINGKTITEGDIEFLATINPRLKAQAASPFGQKQIVDNLVEQELLFQESTKRGLERDAAVKAKADLYRRVIIAQAVLDDEMEKSAQKYFAEHKGEFEKLELSHLLIRFKGQEPAEKGKPKTPETVNRSEEQALALANQVKGRLDKGDEFAKVAKEVSEDTGSKNAGGMLGKVWKQEPRLERRGYGPLLEKAFAMKVGEVAGPIKSQEGYHLITVTKGIEAQSFEDAKQSIYFKLQGDIRTKFLADLKQKAKVEYAEGLGDPKTPAPNAPKPEGKTPKTGETPTAAPTAPPATPAPATTPAPQK